MPSTTAYKRGDVVLVPFPFTDLSGLRNRPALVLSRDTYNQTTGDVMVVQVTGKTAGPPRSGDYYLLDWQAAGLMIPSVVRAKIATLAVGRVRRVLGQVSPNDLSGIENNIRTALDL